MEAKTRGCARPREGAVRLATDAEDGGQHSKHCVPVNSIMQNGQILCHSKLLGRDQGEIAK